MSIAIEELKIELTEACQCRCSFCHQGPRPRRPSRLSAKKVQAWIAWAAAQGIPRLRFTGGEPTLVSALPELARQAKLRGLHVTLNSNGVGDPAALERLQGVVDELKLSLPVLDPVRCDALTGISGALKRKLDTAVLALEWGFELELLTAMVPENIGSCPEFATLVRSLPGARWMPLRLESSPTERRPLSSAMVQRLAEELDALDPGSSGNGPKLRLAMPFCAVEPIELGARVFRGRAEDCGPFTSLTVSAAGELISCYSCREVLPEDVELEHVLRCDEVRHLAAREALPTSCRSCAFVERCMGGCVSPYAIVPSGGGGRDYLARREDG